MTELGWLIREVARRCFKPAALTDPRWPVGVGGLWIPGELLSKLRATLVEHHAAGENSLKFFGNLEEIYKKKESARLSVNTGVEEVS